MRAKILSASAGSGKTYRLAYKFVHDAIKHFPEKPYLYRATLAVTFTNKATEEMKSRILENINGLIECPAHSDYMNDLKRDLGLSEAEIIKRAKAIQSRILHDYSRFTILTIDKFFQRIMRAFIKELGIDINYNIELETSSILSRSTDALIEDIRSDKELQKWITEFTHENIDDNGKWDIRYNMQSLGNELFNERSREALSQPFSREQIHKLIGIMNSRLKAVYTELQNEGKRAMEIISAAGIAPDDFKGKSGSFAHHFRHIANGIIKAPTKTVREKAESEQDWSKNAIAQSLTPQLRPILYNICEIYDNSEGLAKTLTLIKARYRSYALLQDIYQKVCQQCDEEGVMLLSETKYILSQFIAGNDAPFIYEKVGNRYERFMIDEFQDTSAKEWSNFVPLLKNAMAQEEDTSVLIVGDVKQSIYRWRGGDWRILARGVENDLGKEDTQYEFLKDNWRSLRQIVNFNNTAIGQVVEADNTQLNESLDKALKSGSLSRQCYDELYNTVKNAYDEYDQIPRKKSVRDGYVRIEYYNEQPAIIECIESAIARGYKYSDIMILHRSAKDGAAAAEILLDYKRHTGKQFNIMTQDNLVIGNAPICQFIIAVMRLSQDSNDSISRAIVNNYLDRAIDCTLDEQEADMIDDISQLTPEQAFERIVEYYKLNETQSDIAYLQALHEQVTTFCASKVADIQLFLTAWDEKGSSKSLTVEKSDDTIELLTIHKAKGLEKPVIIIPYCSWRLRPASGDIVWATPNKSKNELNEFASFPMIYSKVMEGSAFTDDYYREQVYSHVDAINMLYVALTRASEELYIFIPQKRDTNHVGTLLWDVVSGIAKPCNKELSNDSFIPMRAEYGAQVYKEDTKKEDKCQECDKNATCRKKMAKENQPQTILLSDYPTFPLHDSLKLAAQRYFEDGAADMSSQRNIGIMMHGILCEATNLDDIEQRINEAYTAGRINDKQAAELKATIEREFSRQQVREWFSNEWECIRNENDIICGEIIGTRRPDRVMTRGNKAVVIDYKFGAEKAKSHHKQIKRYMDLLSQMGYTDIEGYIWYLTRSEIINVKNE